MKTDFPSVRVDCEEGKRLGDYRLITQDLETCMESCDRLVTLLGGKSRDQLVIDSLWSHALVKYARCFATGKRIFLGLDIFDGVDGSALKMHKFFFALRDKHVAHSVNDLEQVHVGAILSPPEMGIGISVVIARAYPNSIQRVSELKAHVQFVWQRTVDRGEAYARAFAAHVEKIPRNALEGFPPLKANPVDYTRVDRVRS